MEIHNQVGNWIFYGYFIKLFVKFVIPLEIGHSEDKIEQRCEVLREILV